VGFFCLCPSFQENIPGILKSAMCLDISTPKKAITAENKSKNKQTSKQITATRNTIETQWHQ
jgi:hypothetical protein